MSNIVRPRVKNGFLEIATSKVELDSDAWFAWLDSAESFYYWGDHWRHRLTVRKEKRRHSFYWYAYLKKDSKLHNAYLGKSERLTRAFLEDAALRLASKAFGNKHSIGHF